VCFGTGADTALRRDWLQGQAEQRSAFFMSHLTLKTLLTLLAAWLVLVPSATPGSVAIQSYRTSAVVGFSDLSFNASTAQESATITLVRTGEYREPSSVRFRTVDNTARAGVDYVSIDVRVTFAAGESVRTVAVPLLHRTNSRDGLVLLQLSDPGYNTTLEQSDAILRIRTPALAARPLPSLVAARSQDGDLVLRWPVDETTYVVEMQESLDAPWTEVSTQAVQTGSYWELRSPCRDAQGVYRLRQAAR
jgi:hypothetical protein